MCFLSFLGWKKKTLAFLLKLYFVNFQFFEGTRSVKFEFGGGGGVRGWWGDYPFGTFTFLPFHLYSPYGCYLLPALHVISPISVSSLHICCYSRTNHNKS